MNLRKYLATLPLFLSFALPAQQQSASLTGQIVDTSGAVIGGARVTVSDPDRGSKIEVLSNDHGDYTIPQLPPGEHYVITVDKAGFRQTVQKDVVLQTAQSAKIDFKVAVGDVTQTVEVSTAPPQLDTQTSSLGQVITGQTVENLPLNGRSTFRLIALTPGVTFSRSAYGQFGDVTVNSTFDTNFTINGGRAQSNEILIDGVPSSAGFFNQITTLPSVDDTQEFKVESNNLSAAYGRYAGGAINVSTKSGTNKYHGNVFEFIRNSALDANEWFNKAGGKPIPPFKLNQFGGTIGGPVSIPHLFSGKDRTFFFFSYQGTRRVKGTVFNGILPTVAQRTGDFSALCTSAAPIGAGGTFDANGNCLIGGVGGVGGKVTGMGQIYNPFTTNATSKMRSPFPFNMIPAALIDPVASKIQTYYPVPNQSIAGSNSNFLSNAPVRVSQNTYSGRIDQNVTAKYHLFGRYAYSNTPLTQPNTFGNIADPTGAVGTTNFKNQSFAFDNLYQISPSLLLTVDYGFARWYQKRQTLSFGFDNGTLGFPSALVSAITIPMFPAITIGGYTGLANQSFLNNGNDSHALLVSLTKVAGRHALVGGVDGRIHRINFFNVSNSGGQYNFAIAQTQGPTATTAQTNSGNAYASFLLGAGSSGTIPIGSGSAIQSLYGAVYIQDNIRLNQRLTINLGVRYDGETPNIERHDALNYFDPTIASPATSASFPQLTGGLSFASKTGNDRSVYSRDHGNVVPRVGFAYNPQASTVLRGGFGMSYAPLELSNNAVGFTPTLGYSSSTAWNTSNDAGLTPANLLRNPYPQGLVQPTGNTLGAGTQLGQAITVWNHTPKTPLSLQWNLDVQQQFTPSLLFDLGYSGSRGEHLTGTFERNQLDPKYLSLTNTLTDQVTNPFKPFVTIGALSNAMVARRQLLLPYPQFLSVTEVNNPYGSSTYHSLQTKLVKRASRGATLLVSYTWSKLIANVNAQNAPIGSTDNTSPQNYYDLAAERSVSELDQPHNLVVSGVYELPFGRNRQFLTSLNPFVDKFVSGWKLTSIWTEQSGFPLSLTAAPTGGGNRPDPVVGVDPVINGSRSNQDRVKAWFNVNAYKTPASYMYGAVRRTVTAVRSPGVQNVDASLVKDTRFFEHLDTEFRAEFFNVSNTPHFSPPNTARANANFGVITSTLASPPPREIQFALKIAF